MSDPLPQALVLTAIVISLGTTAFVLAMAYRSWQLTGHDDVQDDVEDAADPASRGGRRGIGQFDLSGRSDEDDDRDRAEEEGRPA